MSKHYILNILFLVPVLLCFNSCKKYLDKKSDESLSTPRSLKDVQALLNNPAFYSTGLIVSQNSSDEYYMPYTTWQSRTDLQKLSYIWDGKLDNLSDWTNKYKNVFYANTVLDAIPDISGDIVKLNEAKGIALFFRANSYYQLLQLYAQQYDSSTASSDLGIVLREDANFTKASVRATVQQAYDRIINDLKIALDLLSTSFGPKTLPNKTATYALLAKVYLQTGDYSNARDAATNCLQLYNQLIDFNDPTEVNTGDVSNPIIKKGINHREIIFYEYDNSFLTNSVVRVDTTLYRSYEINDLRRSAFFRPITSGFTSSDPADQKIYRFKGSYSPDGLFAGLSTPEMYLLNAECNARLNNTNLALQSLNALLLKRYKTGTFVPVTAASADEALTIILKERRKEMLYRGVRWSDLRRLNKNTSTALTLTRLLNGQTYSLPPNDSRYTLLIPQSIMELSNLIQNPR